jgi:ribosomal protein L37AE/L43A
MSMSELQTIAAYQYVAEAELLQSKLEAEGIDAYLENGNLIAMDWLMSNAVGGVKVQVAAKDVAAAQRIVAEVESSRRQRVTGGDATEPIVFACENCGKQIEFPSHRSGGVEVCKHCGRYVDVPE